LSDGNSTRRGLTPSAPTAAAAGIALAAVIVVLVGTRSGSLVGLDSAVYLAGARNLAAGRGYTGFDLRPTTLFPPGFSATLAGPEAIGIGAARAARWLNALTLGATVLLTFALARRHTRYRWTPVLAAAGIAAAPASFGVYTAVWSEPAFCALTLGVLLLLERAVTDRPPPWTVIAWAGVLTSAAVAYRYAGVAVVATGVIALLTIGAGSRQERIRRTAAYAAVSAVAPILIVARNLSYGTLFGPRTASAETAATLAREALTAARGWVTGTTHDAVAVANVAMVIALALIVAGAVTRARSPRGPAGRPLSVIVTFVAVYVVYLTASELVTTVDPLGDRLLAPVLAPLIVLAGCCLEALIDGPVRIPRVARVVAVGAVTAIWLAVSAGITFHRAGATSPSTNGYAARWWATSTLVGATRRIPRDAAIATNNPAGVYLATGHQPVIGTPVRVIYRSPSRPPGIAAFRAHLDAHPGPHYLVWERLAGDTWDLTPADLAAGGLRLVPVATADYGTVYRIGAP
jgi:hypothetical protein